MKPLQTRTPTNDRATERRAGGQVPGLRERVIEHVRRNHPDLCRHWFDQIDVVAMDGANLTLLM